MSMTALEIMAVFRIDEQPALRSLKIIAEQARALSQELKDIALGINKNFATAFSGMSTGIAGQKTEVAQLATEWRNVERAALAAGRVTRTGMAHPRPGAVPGVAAGSHGGGRSAFGFRPSSVGVPGVGHFHGGGI